MKKYAITHEDGTKDIFTTRFTKEELNALAYAVELAFGDLDVFIEDKQNDVDKLSIVLASKLKLRGVTRDSYRGFIDEYID